ncbi:DUF6185 family protein [Streptomyces phaeochromogenes]|uniref:DUF6185 family protein n=1 Tax=Streptomyces phaeochromogenes TaxID=1923 RepID=UPI003864F40C|nr:DUF6185 family protein [Streptomyces phaeochromogenes]
MSSPGVIPDYPNEPKGYLAFDVASMLLVLTVTGIALDMAAFQEEHRFWHSRLSLLLSVYQMRQFSLQMAYLLAQVIAVVSIWQFVAGSDASPPTELPGR